MSPRDWFVNKICQLFPACRGRSSGKTKLTNRKSTDSRISVVRFFVGDRPSHVSAKSDLSTVSYNSKTSLLDLQT